MNWTTICQYHRTPPIQPLSRTDEIQSAYDLAMAKFAKDGVAISDHIVQTVFPKGKLWTLVPNEYPYNCAKGIRHCILWFRGEICPDSVLSDLGHSTYIYFENTPGNRSVKDLRHMHVFIKDNDQ